MYFIAKRVCEIDLRFKNILLYHYLYLLFFSESGKHFGEAALMGEDKTRNATILADECCDFLVIQQKLFDRCLKVRPSDDRCDTFPGYLAEIV